MCQTIPGGWWFEIKLYSVTIVSFVYQFWATNLIWNKPQFQSDLSLAQLSPSLFHIFPNLNYFAIILQYYLYKKCLHFKFFPISVEGGVIENQIFPKFKIVHIILGGGGVKKIMDFSTICDISFLDCSPYLEVVFFANTVECRCCFEGKFPFWWGLWYWNTNILYLVIPIFEAKILKEKHFPIFYSR